MTLLIWILDLCLATGPLRMVIPGEQWREDLPKSLPGDWWALCGDKLVPGKLRVKPIKSDFGPGMVKLDVKECRKAPMLLRDVEGLTPEHVETARVDGLHRVHWKGRIIEMSDGHVARLVDGKTSQILVRQVEGALVAWAGDLDGDGELDLLLEAVEDDYTTEHILFLSSGRAPGELVRRAAVAVQYDHC